MVLIIGLISFGVSVSVFGLGFLFFRFSVSAKNYHFGASLVTTILYIGSLSSNIFDNVLPTQKQDGARWLLSSSNAGRGLDVAAAALNVAVSSFTAAAAA